MAVRRTGALLAGLGLLAGCGAPTTQPQVLPRVAAITPAPLPPAATDPTPDGAVAFARSFYATITRAFATADPTLVARLSQPDCRTCALYLASIGELRDKHEHTTPVTFTIRFAAAPATDGTTARVDVQYDVPASRRYNAAGQVVYQEKASIRVNETVELVRVGRSWRVAELR